MMMSEDGGLEAGPVKVRTMDEMASSIFTEVAADVREAIEAGQGVNISRRVAIAGAVTLGAASMVGGTKQAEAQTQTLSGPELEKAKANIQTVNGIPVVATAQELSGIREWIVNSLSNDNRFLNAVLRVVQGQPERDSRSGWTEGSVRYSSPESLQKLVAGAQSAEIGITLPPGARKWTWSQGGRGVEGYEAVFIQIAFKDGRRQILYCHRNFEKIDPNRTKWE